MLRRLVLVILGAVALAPTSARASCVDPNASEPLSVPSGPPGGVWWVPRLHVNVGDTLPLQTRDGAEVDTTVVVVDAGSTALRVPELAEGTLLSVDGTGPTLQVRGTLESPLAALPRPTMVTSVEDTVLSTTTDIALPSFKECGGPGGLITEVHGPRETVTIEVPPGLLLDVDETPPGAAPFDPFELDGADVIAALHRLPDDAASRRFHAVLPGASASPTRFDVHARFARIADGELSDVATEHLQFQDAPVGSRLSCGGCSASGAEPFALALGLSALGRSRRRRSHRR